MAKNKIERIDQEITKVREKIAEYQEKLKALEAQKTEAENLEIVQMVRALRMTPAQLNAMLSGGMNHGRDTGLGVWVNDVNIIWNEKEAGQWEMRPNALLLCLFGTNCNIFLIATFRFIGNSHF